MITEIRQWLKKPIIMDTLKSIKSYDKVNYRNNARLLEEAWLYNSEDFRDLTLQNSISIYLKKVLQDSGGKYLSIKILEQNSFLLASTHNTPQYVYKDEDVFVETFEKGAGVMLLKEEFVDEDNKDKVVTLAHTIDDNGEAIGVLIISMPFEVLQGS